MTADRISIKRMVFVFVLSLAGALLAIPTGFADEPLYIDQDTPFHPSENLTAEVDYTLAQARAEDKLALIIMGANWCHDTRALLRHFGDADLAATLEANYQTLLVDVGYLEFGEEVITRFGMPVIYGTPTVLIVDPASGQLLNKASMFQWRDAYGIELDYTHEYFSEMGSATLPEVESITPQLAALYAEIDAFENTQAQRIYGGFEVLSPMMALSDQDNEPDEYLDYWYQVSDLRYTITGDLANLRAGARERVAAGEVNITLDYPEYPAFSWE